MKRILKYVFLLSLLLFFVGAGGLAYTYIKHPDIQFGSIATKKIEEQKKFPADQISTLAVETDTTDISVIPSADVDIHVNLGGQISEQQRKGLTFETSQSKDGTLSVNVKKGIVFGFPFQFDGRLELIISVPQKAFERIELTSSTGDVKIKNAQAKQMKVETSTGNAFAQDSQTQDLAIHTSTGDVKLADLTGRIDLSTDTGNINATFSKKLEQDLTVDSSTGDVAIQLGALPDALRAELESSTGEIRARIKGLQAEEQKEHSFKAAYGTNGPLIRVTTSTGEIELTQKQ
ncbi:hypothetical protein EDM56_08780 [Brevibacillus fluminis]|uniref:DUF4097 domain-containing protein n=1 Tax=Brevibacillus fluminis TaxID=511487 RepID=A0A3M8DUD7_9BACL|nr:DUF4097 family beta strand repeat-containing protein [Brevibacillus fluminis]RNB90587.1 hypothetical protein EDM56_08780 [Brevibacillus fluminis]